MPASTGAESVFSGRWMVASANRPAVNRYPRSVAARSPAAARVSCTASTTVLPVSAIRSAGTPSARSAATLPSVGAQHRSA